MIQAWRIVKKRHAEKAITGHASKRLGSRWNYPGSRLIYSSGSLSLAAFELLVHYEPISLLKINLVSISVTIPSNVSMTHCLVPPEDWQRYPAPDSTKAYGDRWLKDNKTAVLCVPSAIMPKEYHYLINPEHPDFEQIVFQAPSDFKL